MKNLSILSLIAILFLAVSCDDDEGLLGPTGTVNMNWTGVYDADPLVMINQEYDYHDGKKVYFKDVNFFISEIVLLEEESGDEVEISDVEFVDFSGNGTVEEAKEALVFSKTLVPVGNYKSIRIGFGVPEDLNNSEANQFGEGHPLRENFGHFWSDWGSFIFTKINGQYDENGDGIFDGDDPGFSHHLGSDAVYRTVTFDTPIAVEEGQSSDLNFVFDLKQFYAASASDYFDMTDTRYRHTNDPGDLTVGNYLVENFQTAVTIE